MIPHRIRLYLILAALAACLAALAALALGVDATPVASVLPALLAALGLPAGSLATAGPPELAAALVACVALLVPAALDAVRVEWRRRDPSVSAIGDDQVDPAALARRTPTRRRRRATVIDDTVPSRRDPPAGPLALALVVLAAACSVASSGCGMSPIRQHSTAVVALASAHTVAHSIADAARTEALDRVEAEHAEDHAARTAARRAEHERWQPVGHALDATREAVRVYLEAVAAAHAADAGEEDLIALLLPVARRAATLYAAISAMLRELGVDAPSVPPILDALLGGAR